MSLDLAQRYGPGHKEAIHSVWTHHGSNLLLDTWSSFEPGQGGEERSRLVKAAMLRLTVVLLPMLHPI